MKIAFMAVMVVLGMLALGLATNWFGLVAERPMQKYAEETRHQVFQQSAAREEGINKSILSECLSMRSAPSPDQKQALAKFIIADAGSYEGRLTPAAEACVQEAGRQ